MHLSIITVILSAIAALGSSDKYRCWICVNSNTRCDPTEEVSSTSETNCDKMAGHFTINENATTCVKFHEVWKFLVGSTMEEALTSYYTITNIAKVPSTVAASNTCTHAATTTTTTTATPPTSHTSTHATTTTSTTTPSTSSTSTDATTTTTTPSTNNTSTPPTTTAGDNQYLVTSALLTDLNNTISTLTICFSKRDNTTLKGARNLAPKTSKSNGAETQASTSAAFLQFVFVVPATVLCFFTFN